VTVFSLSVRRLVCALSHGDFFLRAAKLRIILAKTKLSVHLIMKISQTHRMSLVFWIALPTLLVVLGISFYLQNQNLNSFINVESLPPFFIIILVLGLLWTIKLQWTLDQKQFSFIYRPFIWKRKTYALSDIQKIEISKINPLKDFGGWGLRYSTKLGKAYTTQGNTVLRIHLNNQKILNFTAQISPELTELVESLSKKTQD
jgi:hypothetical protein